MRTLSAPLLATVVVAVLFASCREHRDPVAGQGANPPQSTIGSPDAAIATAVPAASPASTAGPPRGPSKDEPLPLKWRWESGKSQVFAWVRAFHPHILISYGEEYRCCANYFTGPGGVALLDEEDGRELWRFPTPAQAFPAAVSASHLVFGSADGTVYGLSLATGQRLWQVAFPGVPFQALAAGPVVIVADADPEVWGPGGMVDKTRMAGHVWALDPATGAVRWRLKVGRFEAFVVAAGDSVVIASNSSQSKGDIVTIDVGSGRERWRTETPSATTPPVVTDRFVVVPGAELVALDLATGKVAWSTAPVNGGAFSFPVVFGDAIAAAANTHTFELHAAATGVLVASTPAPECAAKSLSLGAKLYALFCIATSEVIPYPADKALQLTLAFAPQARIQSVTASSEMVLVAVAQGMTGEANVFALKPR